MKPTSHNAGRNQSPGENEFVSGRFPITDSSYQSVTLDGYRGGCINDRAHSFRNISAGYFEGEARRSFVTEAAFFALIVATTIVPVLQNAQAVTHLVRAFAGV
ncbi:MAG: hypothetical protein ACJ8M1_00730 [Chthoniobacterales bacterium]